MREDRTGRSWWKFLLGLAAIVGAAIAWGWLEPQPELEAEPEPPEGGAPPAIPEETAPLTPALASAPAKEPPPWVRPTMLWSIGVVLAVVVGVTLLGILSEVLTWIVLALFFSFALEPAVNYLHRRLHWRRGYATFALIATGAVALVAITLVFVVALVQGVNAIVVRIPEWSQSFATWAADTFGAEVSTTGVEDASSSTSATLEAMSANPLEALLGFSVSMVGGFFAFFTVATFCFYMVAEGPRFKRAVLTFFSPKRQDELVAIWEAAIDKTGGYFYSRLLVAVINGLLSFVVLWLLDVPGAVALASFQGVVAAFIPIVGTYIGSAVPIVVALLAGGPTAALIYLGYVLVYQQVENYLIAPKLQGRVMALHPAVAFGAAMAGGALGGLLWAFLALPFAATVQASASLWVQRHEVVESPFVQEPIPSTPPEPRSGHEGWTGRVGSWARRRRGWLRRIGEGGEDDNEALRHGEATEPARPPSVDADR